MELAPLGATGLRVSPLGLGTVKFGRTAGVRYPTSFSLPTDEQCRTLLTSALDLGINLIDTAPAYGASEERLGALLEGQRGRWIICTKCGEEFDGHTSRFDFTAVAIRASVERSLRRLRTDALDIALIHSDGSDTSILASGEAVGALRDMQRRGLIRAVGMSVKTIEGARTAVRDLDVVMLTYNVGEPEMGEVIRESAGAGILVKKPLGSGHLAHGGSTVSLSREEAFAFILREPNVAAAIVGTINASHLRENVRAASTARR